MSTKRARTSSDSTPNLKPPCNRQRTPCATSSGHDHTTTNGSRTEAEAPGSSSDDEQYGYKYGRRPTDEDLANLGIGLATSGRWVGPMDPTLFLQRFLPEANDSDTAPRPDFKAKIPSEILECSNNTEMYGIFATALSAILPRLEFVKGHTASDNLWNGIAVDDNSYSCSSSLDDGKSFDKNDVSRIEIPLIFKRNDDADPFVDSNDHESVDENPHPFESDEDRHHIIRGQISSCLSAVAGAQFRIHIFAILICGQWARLLRWDRNGVVVTQKFKYVDSEGAHGGYLLDLVWRCFRGEQRDDDALRIRGHDPTVKPQPQALYQRGCEPHTHTHTPEEMAARIELAEANRTHHREFRIMGIPDRDDADKEYQFLISYPTRFSALPGQLPFGRTTRPMLAFDLDKNKLVFVKDYWRSITNDADKEKGKEGDIYKTLHDAHVPYLPPFGKGNDIRDHVTLTDALRSEDWAFRSALKMVPLQHYRMSLDEIGRPLSTFKSTRELITAVADAMEAHECAFYEAGILHRDISTGNILINKSGRGTLIDWDLCLNVRNSPPTKSKRTGTWHFLSAYLLSETGLPHGIIDDNESSLYVILWNVLRYTPHNRINQLPDDLELFDQVYPSGDCGGGMKTLFLLQRHRKFVFDGRPHLDSLIAELCKTFAVRYQREPPLDEGPLARERYAASERKIAERSWLVGTMRKYLALDGWPEGDSASLNKCRYPLSYKFPRK